MAERIEVVEVWRRRRWSVEEKLRIVDECDLAGAVPADLARRYDISTGLLYTWKRMAQGRPARSAASGALVPVHVAEPASLPRGRPPRAARLEIGLPGGIRLKVDCGVESGQRTYISTTSRITSGELSNQRNGLSGLRRRGMAIA